MSELCINFRININHTIPSTMKTLQSNEVHIQTIHKLVMYINDTIPLAMKNAQSNGAHIQIIDQQITSAAQKLT